MIGEHDGPGIDANCTRQVWAVGERVHARLVGAIGPLVGEILVETESRLSPGAVTELHLFYNRPTSGSIYAPATQRLLPLGESYAEEPA